MRVRVAGIWQHPRSKMMWFRMAVPQRYRQALGKREIKISLQTTDVGLARQRHADKLRETHALFARLDAQQLAATREEAERLCARGFSQMAARNLAQRNDGVTTIDDALDSVVWAMSMFMAYRVRLTWGPDHAHRAEMELMGNIADDFIVPATEPLGFADPADQELIVSRIAAFDSAFVDLPCAEGPLAGKRVLSGNPVFDGLGSREIARALLATRSWGAAEHETLTVAYMAGVDVVLNTALFDALAECVLRRLAEHRAVHWPANADQLVPPILIAQAATGLDAPPAAPTAPLLSELFVKWCERRRLGQDRLGKTGSEWKLGLTRFIDLHGDLPVDRITKKMITDFRDTVSKLPSRPERSLAKQSLAVQIEMAIKLGLPRLSPPSVEKNVTSIRSLLAIAVESEDLGRNVAKGVVVDGAGYVGDERDRLSNEDLITIYHSAWLTDPDACSDTMFWIMFMAPFQGARPGEHCKLKPEDVIYDAGVPIVRIRRDMSARSAPGHGRRQKTTSSIRDTPLHWILEEAGFMAFVAHQQKTGATWLFDDLVADLNGDRFKNLSRRIMRVLRELGITAPDKAFYSTRHSTKRETRKKRIAEQNADQLFGHANRNIGRLYGQGVGIEELKEDIDKLEFAGVDWDAVVLCGRLRVARLNAGEAG